LKHDKVLKPRAPFFFFVSSAFAVLKARKSDAGADEPIKNVLILGKHGEITGIGKGRHTLY